MAGLLGRSPSTVSREIRRNGGYDGYRVALADDKAWARSGGFPFEREMHALMSIIMDLIFREYLKAKLAEMKALPAKAAGK
jgi:IS30 family transposase